MKDRKGFTLLEMLLIIVFIGTAFFSILQVLTASLYSESDLDHTFVAMNLASEKMEEFYNKGFSLVSSEATAEVSGFPGYFISTVVSSAEPQLKLVDVAVTWLNGRYGLSTYKSSY